MSDTWIDVRRKAREWHAVALAESKGDRRAAALIEAACRNDDLAVSTFQRGAAYPADVLGLLDVAPEPSLAMALIIEAANLLSVACIGAFSLWRQGVALADVRKALDRDRGDHRRTASTA